MAGGRRRARRAGRLRAGAGAPGARRRLRLAGVDGARAARPRHRRRGPATRPLRGLLGRRADPGVAGARPGVAARTCCCWTSPPTTSTSTPWSGSSATIAELGAAVLLVSHDRWFLESVATGVLELDRGRVQALADALLGVPARAGPGDRPPGRRGRAPGGRDRAPRALRHPLARRHQVAPGGLAPEAAGQDRARRGAHAGRPPGLRVPQGPSAAAGWCWRSTALRRRGARAHAGRRRGLHAGARPAAGRGRPERRRQDHPDRDAHRPARAGPAGA